MQEIGLEEYGNVGNFNFGLNGPTSFINCLLEVGFLSNIDDEQKQTTEPHPKVSDTDLEQYKCASQARTCWRRCVSAASSA